MSALNAYFEKFALVAMEKQESLLRILGEHLMELDLDAGKARFSGSIELPFQVLGTESENSLTWLWAWAEEQTEIPEDLIRSSVELREWGRKEGIEEFTLPSVDLNRADGTMLSLIASEVCNAGGYYADHYEGGTLFLLLSADAAHHGPGFDRAGLIHQLAGLAARYDFNHRNALQSYFHARNIPFSAAGNIVSAGLAGGERVIAEFDAAGQIRTINGEPLL